MKPPSTESTVTTNKLKAIILLKKEVKRDLERLSKSRNRSMSNLVETLIMDEIKQAKESGELPEIPDEQEKEKE